MDKFFKTDWKIVAVIYILIALFCTGMGMGVPFFNILLGTLVGWWAAGGAVRLSLKARDVLRRILLISILTSGFTLLMMLIIWAPMFAMLWDANADFANFGIPMILYDPLWSFLGWQVLMIFISPFLQLLMSIFGGFVYLLCWHSTRD